MANGVELEDFRHNMFPDKGIKELHDFIHPEDMFPDTNNRGGVCYFIIDKNYDNTANLVKVVTHNKDKDFEMRCTLKNREIDIFIGNSQTIAILDKVLPIANIDTFDKHIFAAKAFGFRTFFMNDERFKKQITV